MRLLVVLLAVVTTMLPPAAAEATLPSDFSRSLAVSGLAEPTAIAFTPDGRMLIAERGGRILILPSGAATPTTLVQLSVNTVNGERGLVGLVVDPGFASNGWIYAYYTTTQPRNRVGRFTVVGNTASPASEVLVWQNTVNAADYHHGGGLRFGPDGNLYISTGDQVNSANAQTLSNLHGKLLRVRPNGTIPSDNPFVGVAGAEQAIWAYGLRNPFRITFDALTGALWIGDVGGNVAGSQEEINPGVAGANYGWPKQEGTACNVTSCSDVRFPAFAYQNTNPTYASGNQASIILGPVYRATMFPPAYRGNLFFADYANRWIRRAAIDANGAITAVAVFDSAPSAGTIVDLAVGPDGALYYVTMGVPWSGGADTAGVYRIAYVGIGNQPPVPSAQANVTVGATPLAVQFSSSGTSDPDGGPLPLTYAWTFGDGATSTAVSPQHVYTVPGKYQAVLTVNDGADAVAAPPIAISAGQAPSVTITAPAQNTSYRAGDVIAFAGTATDLEDGTLSASAFSWQAIMRHGGHTHPFYGPHAGITAGSITIPASGHAPENTHYEILVTVSDSDGLQGSATRTILPVTATLQLDTTPSGIPVFVDGEAVTTPKTIQSLVGFQHDLDAQASYVLGGTPYLFSSWSDAGPRLHTLTSPEGGASVTASYSATACTGDSDGDGVCNEIDDCPTVANAGQQDADHDAIGDACDACSTTVPGQTEWKSARLQTGRVVDGVAMSDRLSLLGRFSVASGNFDGDPLADGVRIEIRGSGATPPTTITLPPGAYDSPGPGWTTNGRRRFTFQDKRLGGANGSGVNKMTIVDRRSGVVQVALLGRSAAFGFTSADLPLQATVVLGDASASTTGRCGVLTFAAEDCRVRSAGRRIDCR